MGKKRAATKRAKARATTKRKATRRALSSSPSTTASALQPLTLVREMQSYRTQLTAERRDLDDKIEAIDRALAELGQKPGGRSARKASGGQARAGSLKAYIEKVLGAGDVMSVKDITANVLKSGFKTRNKTLGTSVGIALSQMSNVKKVSRGKYALR